MTTSLSGRLWKFGDNVCGDDGIIEFSIIREGFGRPFNEEELRTVCFRQIRPEFPSSVRKGDIVVGGRNFAHHNHVEVPAAIKFSGISAVVVESCESGFIRRALNLGLPVVTCPGISAAVADGETLSLDPASGEVTTAAGRAPVVNKVSRRRVRFMGEGGRGEDRRVSLKIYQPPRTKHRWLHDLLSGRSCGFSQARRLRRRKNNAPAPASMALVGSGTRARSHETGPM